MATKKTVAQKLDAVAKDFKDIQDPNSALSRNIKSLAKDISAGLTATPVTVEGVKLPIQPVIIKSDKQAAPAVKPVKVKKAGVVNGSLSKPKKVVAPKTIPGTKQALIGGCLFEQPTLPADYEFVNHPKHYNTHKSGVEAIDLCEVLSFNVGSAFKYVYRRDDKLTPVQDLQKAVWYIEREIARVAPLNNIPERFRKDWISCPDWTVDHDSLAERVIKAESTVHARNFYSAILQPEDLYYYGEALKRGLVALNALIKSYEKQVSKVAKVKSINPKKK
jgi:hypothetical protein